MSNLYLEVRGCIFLFMGPFGAVQRLARWPHSTEARSWDLSCGLSVQSLHVPLCACVAFLPALWVPPAVQRPAR